MPDVRSLKFLEVVQLNYLSRVTCNVIVALGDPNGELQRPIPVFAAHLRHTLIALARQVQPHDLGCSSTFPASSSFLRIKYQVHFPQFPPAINYHI